ncbi:hypothetical protein CSKR_110074, partial [Clonorchis sinensis]
CYHSCNECFVATTDTRSVGHVNRKRVVRCIRTVYSALKLHILLNTPIFINRHKYPVKFLALICAFIHSLTIAVRSRVQKGDPRTPLGCLTLPACKSRQAQGNPDAQDNALQEQLNLESRQLPVVCENLYNGLFRAVNAALFIYGAFCFALTWLYFGFSASNKNFNDSFAVLLRHPKIRGELRFYNFVKFIPWETLALMVAFREAYPVCLNTLCTTTE